jgi:hypothetical protein
VSSSQAIPFSASIRVMSTSTEGRDKPHGQHRHERLPPGQHARVHVPGEDAAGLLDGFRPDVVELGWLHG